jgi:hypothetical protein
MALEQQFVIAEELIGAFQVWRNQPDDGQILISQGKISVERIESLEKLVGDSSLLRNRNSAGDTDGNPTTTWRPDSTPLVNGVEMTLSTQSLQEGDAIASGGDVSARFKPIRLPARGAPGVQSWWENRVQSAAMLAVRRRQSQSREHG